VLQNGGLVQVWITKSTAKYLEIVLGSLEVNQLSKEILNFTIEENTKPNTDFVSPYDIATPILVKKEAYEHLKNLFEHVNDEYLFQQFALNIK